MNPVIVLLLASALLIPALAAADPCASAKDIVRKYVALDTAGETSHTSKAVDALVDYSEGDTAGWDTSKVIRGAEILTCKPDKKGIRVSVRYVVLGSLASSGGKNDHLEFQALPSPKKETLAYQVVQVGDQWKITSRSLGAPRVGISGSISQVESGSGPDAVKKQQIDALKGMK